MPGSVPVLPVRPIGALAAVPEPSVIPARVHHFPTDPFCWYVVEENGRLTLVDAGFAGHYRVFRAGLQSIGRDLSDVEAVVLTHAHADHTGFADRVRRETGARVFVHRDDMKKAERRLQLPWHSLLRNVWRPFGRRIVVRGLRGGLLTQPPVRELTPVNDGDTLDIPGHPTVLHAPGHTPGSVAFHLPSHGVLFTGDAVVTQHMKTGRHLTPHVATFNMDGERARQSAKRFYDLGALTVLGGHGRAWHGELASLDLTAPTPA